MSDTRHDVFIGLGSNLGDPQAQLRQAFAELHALPSTRLCARSPLYRSAPLGPADQPDYLNAVAHLETALEPQPLLEQLQAIEDAHDRVREQRWGPRTLDLDVLLYADREIATQSLTVPHPHLRERAFVLVPLYDVAPTLHLPGGDALASLVETIDRSQLQCVGAD